MKKNTKIYLGVAAFLLFNYFLVSLSDILPKARIKEIKKMNTISGRIISVEDKGRGLHVKLAPNVKIYTNAFSACVDTVNVGDSISKNYGSEFFYYYKKVDNNYVFIDSCLTTWLSLE